MKTFKVFLLCLSFIFLSGCIASSKHVKKLDKIVEAQAIQVDTIVNVLDQKGLLTVEQADVMHKNSTAIVTSSHDQVNESASIFTWKIFTWAGFTIALSTVAKVAKDFVAGNYVGIASTLATAGVAWYLKNKAVVSAVAENDAFHTADKVELVAKVLAGDDITKKQDTLIESATKIVEKHEA